MSLDLRKLEFRVIGIHTLDLLTSGGTQHLSHNKALRKCHAPTLARVKNTNTTQLETKETTLAY